MIQQVLWQNIEHKWVKGEKEICPSVHTFGQCSDKLCKSYISRIYVALLKMLIPNYMPDLDGKIYNALILLKCDPDDFAPLFIELPSQHFKTASMLAKKLHFLPITALVFPFQAKLGFIITFKRDVIWDCTFLEIVFTISSIKN